MTEAHYERLSKIGRLPESELVVLMLLIVLVGCGGGSISRASDPPASTPPPVVTPPVNPPTPPPPPPPPSVPMSWTVTDLMPLSGFNAAQANAVNSSGVVAGYSEMPDGTVEATEWMDGAPIDLGPGIAVAINDSGQIVGYSVDSTGTVITAHLWQNGVVEDLGQWLPTGINPSGIVVGNGSGNAPQAIVWQQGTALVNIAGCQYAFAINASGQIAGIGNSGNATICGQPDFGELGAASAINTAGQAVGYGNPSAAESDAEWWPSTVIAVNGLATGINDFGWVVGETINQGGENARSLVDKTLSRLAGESHPFIWSQASGPVALPSPMITAEAISGKFVCGTQLAADGTIHGVLLEGN